MKSLKKQESNIKSIILDDMMIARKYMAKAANHARKVSESYKMRDSNISNIIASSSFDLALSLIDSMNKSTHVIDLFTLEIDMNS